MHRAAGLPGRYGGTSDAVMLFLVLLFPTPLVPNAPREVVPCAICAHVIAKVKPADAGYLFLCASSGRG